MGLGAIPVEAVSGGRQPVHQVEPYLGEVRAAIGRERGITLLLLGFAGAALLLSVLGIYGVVAGGPSWP